MGKLKVMFIFGTRPEVIKLAPVIQEMARLPLFEPVLVATGQHREMLSQALDLFGIEPDYDLDIMQPDQGVTDITVNALVGLEQLIAAEKPDLVMVQGDTTTAFAGCLASFYQKIPVAHVEAGLRTYDKYRPFPEEINRSLITHLADLHFVPTAIGWDALRREGIPEDRIFVTGNTVIDALFQQVSPDYVFTDETLRGLDTEGRRLLVVTAHRRENFGQPILEICAAVRELVEDFRDVEVVFSVHRNPRVREPVKLGLEGLERVHLVDPLDYADMVNLVSSCYLVMTDSGGLQEEAPALAKPVLVLRDVTERPEAVQAGMARITGTSKFQIVKDATELLLDQASYEAMRQGRCPYGDGKAASRIRKAVEFVQGVRAEKPAAFDSATGQAVTSGELPGQPVSNELFYQQLDERINRAKKMRQRVSVADFNLEQADNAEFAAAVRNLARGLRKTDTAAALDGRHFVLVMPGTGREQASRAAERLIGQLAVAGRGRRSTDAADENLFAGIRDKVSVKIETYGSQETMEE